jgi:hypothetical protein
MGRTEVYMGIFVLVICTPTILVIAFLAGVLPDLNATIGQIIISVVPAMIVGGASLIWFGRKPDAQELSRKQDIHGAIKKWVELPVAAFDYKSGTLPLAEKPPELAAEIEECLSRKYPSIHTNLQKFRQDYREWQDTESSSKFTTVEDGRTVINIDYVRAYDNEMAWKLTRAHGQLAEQFNSEIVDKHFTRLKC